MGENGYTYDASVKSGASDELINTYVMRPIAGILVRGLYRTSVTPNELTLAASASGLVAAVFYWQGAPLTTLVAGLFLWVKDLLDSADGQLARAKGMFSRTGRFLDSIGDIFVNFAVFFAIGYAMVRSGGTIRAPFFCLLAFLGTSLRVSYHVFYQTSFLHLRNAYAGNRTSEEIRAEDAHEDRRTAALHRTFLLLYGWQDRLIARLDALCRGENPRPGTDERWFGDATGVRLSGFLGLGTEIFVLTMCSVAGRLDVYLGLNIVVMNLVWLGCVLYRRVILRRNAAGTGRRGINPPGSRTRTRP